MQVLIITTIKTFRGSSMMVKNIELKLQIKKKFPQAGRKNEFDSDSET